MDDNVFIRARADAGLVRSVDLGPGAARTARRHGLVALQPRVWIARTQPQTAREHVSAVQASAQGEHAFVGMTALWLYGLAPAPEVVRVGVRHATRLRSSHPVRVTRLSSAVLRGSRTVDGASVVALEMALVQATSEVGAAGVMTILEAVLRQRLTTVPRLRSRCRRGVAGSRALRAAIDELVGVSLDGAVRELITALEHRGVTGLRTEVHFTSAGGASAYADVLDEASQSVIEVDGFLTHTERRRFRADRRRDRWLHAEHGLVTFRVDVTEISESLERLADELTGLILARRAAVADSLSA